jgi:hypothetical protein
MRLNVVFLEWAHGGGNGRVSGILRLVQTIVHEYREAGTLHFKSERWRRITLYRGIDDNEVMGYKELDRNILRHYVSLVFRS